MMDDPMELDHGIRVKDDSGMERSIPLGLNCVTSYFVTRKPTQDEMENVTRAFQTDENLTWDPHEVSYGIEEEAITKKIGTQLINRRISCTNVHLMFEEEESLAKIGNGLVDRTLLQSMETGQ